MDKTSKTNLYSSAWQRSKSTKSKRVSKPLLGNSPLPTNKFIVDCEPFSDEKCLITIWVGKVKTFTGLGPIKYLNNPDLLYKDIVESSPELFGKYKGKGMPND
jgi:hypothetical protein